MVTCEDPDILPEVIEHIGQLDFLIREFTTFVQVLYEVFHGNILGLTSLQVSFSEK